MTSTTYAGCVSVLQLCLLCADLPPCLWLSAEEARRGPLSLIVALPDLQALPGLQQEGGKVLGGGWVVAARGSLALDTSDDLEVRRRLCYTLCSPRRHGHAVEDSSSMVAGRSNLARGHQ